jgi:hypothetical protein
MTKTKKNLLTFCSLHLPFRRFRTRETAVQGQTAATSCRVCRESTPTAESKELNTL